MRRAQEHADRATSCVAQLAVEAVFLEVTQRLSSPAGAGLSAKQADALQHLAFDWILYADKYVDPRFPELALYRDQVTWTFALASRQLLNALCAVSAGLGLADLHSRPWCPRAT